MNIEICDRLNCLLGTQPETHLGGTRFAQQSSRSAWPATEAARVSLLCELREDCAQILYWRIVHTIRMTARTSCGKLCGQPGTESGRV